MSNYINRVLFLFGLIVAISGLTVAQTEAAGKGQECSSTSAEHVSRGVQLANAGNVDGANSAFASAIAADSRCADAYYYKAVTLMSKATVDPKTAKLKFPPEVMTNLNDYLALAPNGPNAEAAKALFTTLGEEPKPSSSGFWNSLNNVVQNMQQQQATDPDALLNASQQIEAQKTAGLATLQANQQRQREDQERQREAERQRQADAEARRIAAQEQQAREQGSPRPTSAVNGNTVTAQAQKPNAPQQANCRWINEDNYDCQEGGSGSTAIPGTTNNSGGTPAAGSGGSTTGDYLSPTFNNCIRTYHDPKFYNYIAIENVCSQAISVTYFVIGAPGFGQVELRPGQKDNTARNPKSGLDYYVCPKGYVPVDGTDRYVTQSGTKFHCKKVR